MKLAAVSGDILRAFGLFDIGSLQEIQYTKENNPRDVVTSLDLKIHDILQTFCVEVLQGTTFVSEENSDLQNVMELIVSTNSVLVVDPLDGSNNVVCQMKDIGFMACLVEKGVVVESLIVLPNENQILSWNQSKGLVPSQRLQVVERPSATTYLAYAPDLDTTHLELRSVIMNFLDVAGAGVYRYGSACVGLFRTLIGAHSSFIGLQMRPWDVISYFPVLASQGFRIVYAADSSTISFLVTRSETLLEKSRKLFDENLDKTSEYYVGESLRVSP